MLSSLMTARTAGIVDSAIQLKIVVRTHPVLASGKAGTANNIGVSITILKVRLYFNFKWRLMGLISAHQEKKRKSLELLCFENLSQTWPY